MAGFRSLLAPWVGGAGSSAAVETNTSSTVIYLPIRMASSLWTGGGVDGPSGEVAWLPPVRQPLVYVDSRTGNYYCDPSWYRFFEYIAEKKLGGKTGPTLPAVVSTVNDVQVTSASAAVEVASLQQQTAANAEALYATRAVVKNNGLAGSDQIPNVELL